MLMSLLTVVFIINFTEGNHVITVYGDVYKNTEFFSRTFPWIIDNIGGRLTVEYYLLGSGLHSVPQMCVLQELSHNTFLQAQFLKCETEGNPTEFCICETGVDPVKFKDCVRSSGSLASYAAERFSRLNLDTTPLIEAGVHNTIFEVTDTWYLKKICTLYGDEPPRGCVKPFNCNGTVEWSYKRGIAQIENDCGRLLPNTRGIENTFATTTASATFRDLV